MILNASGDPYPIKEEQTSRKGRFARRNYAGGMLDRLTADFQGTNLSANQLLRNRLERMRMRCRQLVMDNDYARKFVSMVKSNVIGPNGIRLQARAQQDNGSLDTLDNQLIESAFADWGRMESCTVSRMLTWEDVQRQVVSSVAVDGEVLVRFFPGNGPGRFALQVIEGDFLDINHNEDLRNGNRIVMGVELNRFGAPVNYHLTTPSNDNFVSGFSIRTEVVPADQMLHIFMQNRPDQNRGEPWMASSIRRLNNIGKYEEYELVAAREAASKMGFFTSQDGACQIPDGQGEEIITESSPGHFEWLPEGVDFKPYDPDHPVSAFGDFVQATLRGAASGLNVAYNTLSNDLEGVNFSSIRSGVLEERENWRMLQNWIIGQFHDRVYRKWLATVIGDEEILPLPPRRIRKFQNVKWQPRGWSWVDPLKDINAEKIAHELNVTSLSEIAAQRGKDLEEVFARMQADKALAEQYDVSLEDAMSEMSGQALGEDNE